MCKLELPKTVFEQRHQETAVDRLHSLKALDLIVQNSRGHGEGPAPALVKDMVRGEDSEGTELIVGSSLPFINTTTTRPSSDAYGHMKLTTSSNFLAFVPKKQTHHTKSKHRNSIQYHISYLVHLGQKVSLSSSPNPNDRIIGPKSSVQEVKHTRVHKFRGQTINYTLKSSTYN